MVGQGSAAPKGTAPAIGRGHGRTVATARSGAHRDRTRRGTRHGPRRSGRGLVAGSSYNTLSIDSAGTGGDDDDARAIADTLGDVDTTLDRIENREALRPLLEALPERERMVLVLRFSRA